MAPKREEFKINADELVAKVKELVKAGNVRKIIIRNEKNEDIIEIPLTFAVVGAVIAPVIAAVGAAAALLTKCTIVVERND
jgi:integral membrane sensor domain MASE1